MQGLSNYRCLIRLKYVNAGILEPGSEKIRKRGKNEAKRQENLLEGRSRRALEEVAPRPSQPISEPDEYIPWAPLSEVAPRPEGGRAAPQGYKIAIWPPVGGCSCSLLLHTQECVFVADPKIRLSCNFNPFLL